MFVRYTTRCNVYIHKKSRYIATWVFLLMIKCTVHISVTFDTYVHMYFCSMTCLMCNTFAKAWHGMCLQHVSFLIGWQ